MAVETKKKRFAVPHKSKKKMKNKKDKEKASSLTSAFFSMPNQRRDVAFHEAGHVVAAVAFGQLPHGASIGYQDLDDDGVQGALGTASVSGTAFDLSVDPSSPAHPFRVAEGVWVSLAGYVAEARVAGKPFADVIRSCDDEDPDVRGARKYVAWSLGLGRAVGHEAVWPELLRRASEVDAFIVDHWRHVEAIGLVLSRDGEIDQEGITDVLDGLPDVRDWEEVETTGA